MNINHQVNVVAVTPFERINTHTVRPFTEYFVAITMQTEDGQAFVTFTRERSEFASSVKVGDRFRLGGKFKREQVYNNVYAIVVTHATINKVIPQKGYSKRSLRVRELLGI